MERLDYKRLLLGFLINVQRIVFHLFVESHKGSRYRLLALYKWVTGKDKKNLKI